MTSTSRISTSKNSEILVFKIRTISNNSRKEFVKKFTSMDSFLKYKKDIMSDNVNKIEWQYKKESDVMFSLKESDSVDSKTLKTRGKGKDNQAQKMSRNNSLAVKSDGTMINLNVKGRLNMLNKMLESSPLTSFERKFILGIQLNKKLSVSQYEMLEDIIAKSKRRVKV